MRLTVIIDPLHLWPRATRVGGVTASPHVGDAVDVVLRSPLPAHRGVIQQVLERILSGPEIDELLTAAVESPRMAELADRVLESEGMERLVAQVLESRLVDASVARVLASEELWLVVERVAQSPAVTQAISQQGVGFVDQVAEELGERSRRVDDRLERGVRRFMRRRPAADPVVP